MKQKINKQEQQELKVFEYTDHNPQDVEYNIDPDNNLFSSINNNCSYYTDEQFNTMVTSDFNISMIHFNSRSLYANFNNIKDYLHQFKEPFNIVAISETWLSEEKGVDFTMDGYELNYINRKVKKGGGVAIYVDKSLQYKVVENLSVTVDDLFECITIEICLDNVKNIVVSCVYRTPGSNIDLFKDWMEKMYAKLTHKVMFICGDFNIDLMNSKQHSLTEEFINTMYSMGLHPTITGPSRITSHSATLIDNIFTNIMENNIRSGLLLNDISDHLPIFVVYQCDYRKKKYTKNIKYKRIRTEESMYLLTKELLIQDWKIVYDENDINKAYDKFLQIFQSLYNKNCPIKQYSDRQQNKNIPWVTKGLLNACKKKNTLYKQFIKCRMVEAEIKYKRYKNKLTNIMRTCKKEYYNRILEDNKNNLRGIWQVLNGIISNRPKNANYPEYFIENGNLINNMEDVVSGFNKFFVNVGPELAKSIVTPETNNSGSVNEIEDRNPNTIFLGAVTEKEIIETVSKFKNKKSTDWNEIDMTIVKKVIEGIVKPLTHICNLSFQTGKFPNKMKIAKVIPLYKTGDSHCFTNYRPVSLLSQFSKILEKIFTKRLDDFIEKHNLLTDSQYGFRADKSTSLALIELIEEITSCIDKKKFAVGVFIDLKKAFDTIDHRILLRKLERYGIRGVGLSWVESYLSNRQQFVQIGEHKSPFMDITCGVPQGSVLGPKLFILYINDICQVSKILKFILFADDTNILCTGENLQQVLEVVTTEMKKLTQWFNKNKLSLNLKKTKIMLFGNYKINHEIMVTIDDTRIETVQENKFLGVTLDNKICWKPHISHIRAKLAKCIGILGKTRHILDYKSLVLLYNSLFLPYLNYCVEVWGNTYKTNLQSICTLQKRAIRIINNVGYRDHTNSLFLKSHVIKFIDLVKFKTAQVMYRAINNQLPTNIQKIFKKRDNDHNLRGDLNFTKPKIRTTKKSMCISVCGVDLWNSLEPELKLCTNRNQFKKRYKHYLLKGYMLEG